MAGGIFAILDDVATLLDDAAMMSKVAAKKTAAVLGDDLAVNTEQATGFHASRELPVIWAITKGSLINKLIILPIAFLLSTYLPWLIVPVLLIGGTYLSYEGMEKVYEVITGNHHENVAARETGERHELLKLEATKIKAAIRTDFILSIEIIVIALGTVREASLPVQAIAVSLVAVLATIGVYGLVAILVRMDDAGLYLITHTGNRQGLVSRIQKRSGQLLIAALPRVIRLLGVVGTIAMLLVGGGMYVHNIETIHHLVETWPQLPIDLLAGCMVGTVAIVAVTFVRKMVRLKA